MTTIALVIETVPLAGLQPHPRNRWFPTEGEAWVEFLESLRTRGVVQPLLARPLRGGGLQVIAGHRRRAGAQAVGLKTVPVVIREMDDREALELVVIENLQREDLDPVEEARAVVALAEDLSMTAEEIAARINRGVAWVRTRQLVLELGDDAQAALRLPREDDGHMHIGTVQLLLPLEAEDRQTAVQMILHPDFQYRTLSPRQAEDCIREVIVLPRRARVAWDAKRDALAKEWRRGLRGLALPGTADDVQVRVATWQEAQEMRPGRPAEDAVPLAELLPDAPAGLRWLHLAVRHGVVVTVVPEGDTPDASVATVNELMLRHAEASLAEHGGALKPWLAGKKKVVSDQSSGISGNDRVEGAVSLLDGEGERDYDDTEKPETVIEQTVEQTGVIDLGAVRRLREWALAKLVGEDPAAVPLPPWVTDLTTLSHISAVCDWVLSLKWKPHTENSSQ